MDAKLRLEDVIVDVHFFENGINFFQRLPTINGINAQSPIPNDLTKNFYLYNVVGSKSMV